MGVMTIEQYRKTREDRLGIAINLTRWEQLLKEYVLSDEAVEVAAMAGVSVDMHNMLLGRMLLWVKNRQVKTK